MKASRFSEEQIIGMIKEQEGGMPTADVCRKHGVSSATFYKYTPTSVGWRCCCRFVFKVEPSESLSAPGTPLRYE